MATDFLQQVQSVMEGRFMHDPVLTENVASVDVWDDEYIVVSEIQIPQEVGTISHYLMVHGAYDSDGFDFCRKIIHAEHPSHQRAILSYIGEIAEQLVQMFQS